MIVEQEAVDIDYKKIEEFTRKCAKNSKIDLDLYRKYDVKRGLRDVSGQGVLTGLTEVSEIVSHTMVDRDYVPCEGKLRYRGIDVEDLVAGFIEEERFLQLFDSKNSDKKNPYTIDFETVLNKKFVLYDNDALYKKNTDPNAEYLYDYVGERDGLTVNGDGVEIKITAILRLKDGLTYGCLSSGLNFTEKFLMEYIERNKTSESLF